MLAKDRQIKRLTATIQKSVETLKIQDEIVSNLKGNILSYGVKSLDNMTINKISIAKDITTSVFNLLKDVDSTRKANNAVNVIHSYLETAERRMFFITEETKEIQCLIKNMTDLVKQAKGPITFKLLISDVYSLVEAFEGT